ncbi:DUF3558 domain-containing protein [Nocardia goodfellowii]|uniref:DUF3558 domain-containing protein n=1 Tax=Nocardia goodfellowii TaxID=882446 RepID=A0ABS4QKW6_9NOCA|nr:DUF3558 domain-containing protein [Nocardia goodfellowii]MBP2192348.1 hypothetical protein [Nocardia goodfellowii]
MGIYDGLGAEALVGRRTTATVAALAGVVLVASGCGSKTEGKGGPTATNTSAATATLWDPCTQVSDQALKQVGVKPETKESGVAGVEEPGWKVCSWNNADFDLVVWSTTFGIDDFKKKDGNTDFKDIAVAGRSGVTYHRARDTANEDCDLVFPAAQGAFSISIYNRASSTNVEPPCQRANKAAEVVVPLFPR